jgi:hypothetical protein
LWRNYDRRKFIFRSANADHTIDQGSTGIDDVGHAHLGASLMNARLAEVRIYGREKLGGVILPGFC